MLLTKESILKYYEEKPYMVILFLGLILRLISAIFSQGYAFHDDHYLVLEASHSWVDGADYANWLPQNQKNPVPSGHSFFYVGIHFVLFHILKFVGFVDPKVKMVIIRIIHAFFSLLILKYTYKIVKKVSNEENLAIKATLFMAVLWFMPFLSVRNLVEFISIPFMFWGIWLILNSENKKYVLLHYLFAGFIIGLSFSVRFQTILFAGGVGLVLLFQKKIKGAIIYGVGILLSIILIQGGIDLFVWGRPFAEFTEYIKYNIENRYNYGPDNWHMYISVFGGMLVPPFSLLLLFGFFRNWKKYAIIFVPTLIFILFHNYFPNKQERFIFPVLPFVAVLGVVGWYEFANKSKFWKKHKKLLTGFNVYFWIINIAFLIFFTPISTKLSRIDVMYYFNNKKISKIILEDATHEEPKMLPKFYSNSWNHKVIRIGSKYLKNEAASDNAELNKLKDLPKNQWPEYILFCENIDLDKRVEYFKKFFPKLEHEKTIEPSKLDKIMYKLNTSNRNQTYYIYKVIK